MSLAVQHLDILQSQDAAALPSGDAGDGGQHARAAGPRGLSKANGPEACPSLLVVHCGPNGHHRAPRASQEVAQSCFCHLQDGWMVDQVELESCQIVGPLDHHLYEKGLI
jgi:hypothetical protein